MWFWTYWSKVSCFHWCVYLFNSRDLSVYFQKAPWFSLQSHLFPEWDAGEQVKLLLWIQASKRFQTWRQTRLLWVCVRGEIISLLQVWKQMSFGRGQVCYIFLCMLLLMHFSSQFVNKGISVDEPKMSKLTVAYYITQCVVFEIIRCKLDFQMYSIMGIKAGGVPNSVSLSLPLLILL